MAYYDAFINGWNSPIQPPTGVVGTPLTGLTTANKLTAINGWTVTGTVPTSFFVSGADLLNCINWPEFNALTSAQQNNLLQMCGVQGQLLGGSANISHMAAGMILAYFTNLAGPTIASLTALAKTVTQPWWKAVGYPRAFDMGDVTAAGLS